MLDPINFGAQGDGITDDSDIINSLITEDIIIDLGNKTYKCNKTIDIKYDNVIIQNGTLDFTDIEKNEPFYIENTSEWTTACGIRILGSQESPVELTYGINHQTNHYNDFVRIDKSDNNFNNDDFVFIDSDLIHSDTGGGGTDDGLKNGEIIQIDKVNEEQWEKYSFDENDKTLKGEKPPTIILARIQDNLTSFINGKYFVDHVDKNIFITRNEKYYESKDFGKSWDTYDLTSYFSDPDKKYRIVNGKYVGDKIICCLKEYNNNEKYVFTIDENRTIKHVTSISAPWHGSCGIDFNKETNTICFSTYISTEIPPHYNLEIYKSTNYGETWTVVFTISSEIIRHFHTCIFDEFSNKWYVSSGDSLSECKVFESTDDGDSWTEMDLTFKLQDDTIDYEIIYPNVYETLRHTGELILNDEISVWGTDDNLDGFSRVIIFNKKNNEIIIGKKLGLQLIRTITKYNETYALLISEAKVYNDNEYFAEYHLLNLKTYEVIFLKKVITDRKTGYNYSKASRQFYNNKMLMFNRYENSVLKLVFEEQLNFVNSTYEDYIVKDNAKIAKLNLRKNIILNNLILKSKQLTTEELNNPDRYRAHRTEWRNEKNLVGNEYLGTAIWVQYGYNINVENCKIHNWYDTGIVISRSIQCNINNLECNHIYANGKGYGINIRDGTQKVNIINSSFTDQRHSISIGGLGGISRCIKITNNSINKSRDAGIDSHSAGQFLIIENNHIVCEGSDGEHDGIIIEGLDSIITNNIIEGIIRHGIYIQPNFNYFKQPSYKIDNNIINAKPDYTYSSGINFSSVDSQINNLSISNNTINNELQYGIHIKDDYKITSSKISNNDINLCDKGIYLYKSSNVNVIANNINNQQQNVYIRLCNNININNNIFNTKHECIYIRDSNFITFSDNSIHYNVDDKRYRMLNFYKVNNCNVISNIINGISKSYQSYQINVYFSRCNNIILQSNNIYTDIEKRLIDIRLANCNKFNICNNLLDLKKSNSYHIIIKKCEDSDVNIVNQINYVKSTRSWGITYNMQ
jgi:hypothetical protein